MLLKVAMSLGLREVRRAAVQALSQIVEKVSSGILLCTSVELIIQIKHECGINYTDNAWCHLSCELVH